MSRPEIDWRGASEKNRKLIEEFTEFRRGRQRAKKTIRSDRGTLVKLARFLGKKNFRKATEEDLEKFFKEACKNEKKISCDIDANHIKVFYKWLLKLKKKQQPEIMEWYEYQTKAQKAQDKEPGWKEKAFITPEEYAEIIRASRDTQDKALWETFYYSGGRNDELCSMKIGGVNRFDKDGVQGYEVTVYRSKTIPRIITLEKNPPAHLMKWLEEHPFRDNPKHALWITRKGTPMTPQCVRVHLERVIKRTTGVKSTIKPKNFRATRATIMFSKPKFTDTMIADFFGWTVKQVPSRREQYDLTTKEDLRRKICEDGPTAPSREELEIRNKEAEDIIQNGMENLKNEFEKKMNQLSEENKALRLEISLRDQQLFDIRTKQNQLLGRDEIREMQMSIVKKNVGKLLSNNPELGEKADKEMSKQWDMVKKKHQNQRVLEPFQPA